MNKEVASELIIILVQIFLFILKKYCYLIVIELDHLQILYRKRQSLTYQREGSGVEFMLRNREAEIATLL